VSGSCLVRTTLFAGLLWGPADVVQANPAWVDPQAPTAPSRKEPDRAPATLSERPRAEIYPLAERAQAAQELAIRYLSLWSAPNRVTLASASSFYGSTVNFHGRTRSLSSVIEEKRQFAQRWPDRTYRYRPGTTYVSCDRSGPLCTVWSIFDFSAGGPSVARPSRGIAEHELVVDFTDSRPVIVSENSRVLLRGVVVQAH
jgi:hypothetical protein